MFLLVLRIALIVILVTCAAVIGWQLGSGRPGYPCLLACIGILVIMPVLVLTDPSRS